MLDKGIAPCRNILSLFLVSLLGCQPPEITVSEYPAASNSPRWEHAKVVFLAGPDSHGAGEHQHQAGSELLSAALRVQQPGFEAINVYGAWPLDESIFVGTDAVVLYCDGGSGHMMSEHLDTLNTLLDEGVGVVALHYAVELPKESPAAQTMMRAVGGYFETHWSVNPFWQARYTALPEHEITRGIAPFNLYDEWYFNMRFAPGGITPILEAVPPESTMDRWDGAHSGNEAVRKMVADGKPQVTAWAFERAGGGRGFGYTGGHAHDNWQDDNARQLVLNAIMWVARGSAENGDKE